MIFGSEAIGSFLRVVWGKNMEMKKDEIEYVEALMVKEKKERNGLELQSYIYWFFKWD